MSVVLVGPLASLAVAQLRPAVPAAAPGPAGGTIADVRVEGNFRIEAATIRSYMLVQPGDPFDADRIDRSLKTLYATGLFADVRIDRVGATLVVHVTENPTINRIAFEGNRKINDETLTAALQLKQRGVFTPALAQSDRQRILDLYAAKGRYGARVEPKIIKLAQNRVDVVFQITEGSITLVSRIVFVGNHAFSEGKLRDVVDSREQAWYRFLSSSDEYNPERVTFDKELLRRFYLRNGYVDIAVTGATAELAPDRSSFFLTFTLHEGARYRIGKVSVNSTLRHVASASLHNDVDISAGDWYDGDAVERNVQALTDAVRQRGIAFVEVKPRITRDPKKHTVELVFDVVEAPRVYVERIDIIGNTRTEDKVIRREMRLAEGDAYNDALVRRSKQVLEDLGYFGSVDIAHTPGSAADRTLLTTTVQEKATGQLTIGGGYSTDVGALANIGLTEKNFLGTGVDAGINTIIAQLESQVDLSIRDPYFLDRNMVGGGDLFYINDNLQYVSEYNEERYGVTLNGGYAFSDHLRQALTYSLVSRRVYGIESTASPYVADMAGTTWISQVGQTITLDYRDSTRRSAVRLGGAARHRLRRAGRRRGLRAGKNRHRLLHPARRHHRQPGLGHRDLGGCGLPVHDGRAYQHRRSLLPRRRQPARLPRRRRRPARRAADRRQLLCRQPGRAVHLDAIDRAALPAAAVAGYRPVGTDLRRYGRAVRRAEGVCRWRAGAFGGLSRPAHLGRRRGDLEIAVRSHQPRSRRPDHPLQIRPA